MPHVGDFVAVTRQKTKKEVMPHKRGLKTGKCGYVRVFKGGQRVTSHEDIRDLIGRRNV